MGGIWCRSCRRHLSHKSSKMVWASALYAVFVLERARSFGELMSTWASIGEDGMDSLEGGTTDSIEVE